MIQHTRAQGVPDLAWVFAGSAATWLALAAWSVSKRGYVASGLKPGWRWVKGSVQVCVCVWVVGWGEWMGRHGDGDGEVGEVGGRRSGWSGVQAR